jgi:hypothetical protein
VTASRDQPSGAFTVLWNAIADTMGTATTATLFRRALKRAAGKYPGALALASLTITREGTDYRYQVPSEWSDEAVARDAVCALFSELRPLLIELTGLVVLRRVLALPELRHCDGRGIQEAP